MFDELVGSALADAGRAAAFMQGDASRRVSKHGSGKAPKELVGAWLRDSVTMSDASYGESYKHIGTCLDTYMSLHRLINSPTRCLLP